MSESRRRLNDRRRFSSLTMFWPIAVVMAANRSGGRPPGRGTAIHTAARSGTSAAPGTRTRHRGDHEHSGDSVTCKTGELSAYRRHLMVRLPVPALDLAASQHTAGLASDPALRFYPWEGRLMARLTRRSALHEGPLIEPTAATQRWRRLPLFMPRSGHCPACIRRALNPVVRPFAQMRLSHQDSPFPAIS